MLSNIHPLLTGELLLHLDRMGHSDSLVISDAHFPAWRIGTAVIDLPGADAPSLLAAVLTVVPLDEHPALDLMATTTGEVTDAQRALLAVADADARFLARAEFYDEAARASVIVRTGETRTFANAIVRKGVVQPVR
ncbi:L-fucose mutarotase [soil metagenome]